MVASNTYGYELRYENCLFDKKFVLNILNLKQVEKIVTENDYLCSMKFENG